MLRQFCRRQFLTTLWQSGSLPTLLTPVVTAYQNYIVGGNQGTWTEQVAPSEALQARKSQKTDTLSPQEYTLLKEWISDHEPTSPIKSIYNKVLPLNRVNYRNQTFTGKAHSDSTSAVVTADGEVGYIKKLFQHAHTWKGMEITERFAVIDILREVDESSAALDVYRLAGNAAGRLVRCRWSKSVLVRPLGHFAPCALTSMRETHNNEPVLHAFPLMPVAVSREPDGE